MLEEMRTATIVEIDEGIAEYIRKSYDFQRTNPDLLRMLLWEALECTGDRPLPDEHGRDSSAAPATNERPVAARETRMAVRCARSAGSDRAQRTAYGRPGFVRGDGIRIGCLWSLTAVAASPTKVIP
ncbi:hypothetical protein [Candidatus Frankia alpina]|uniref:hypothetical protein n=1 Tax=Candidatus Frankia alpina TaxID=2699483 RepID=UPI0013D38AF4|nr:hypothetical protein [Candidatus Frankia alpina]